MHAGILSRRNFSAGLLTSPAFTRSAYTSPRPYQAPGDFRLVADFTFGNRSEDATIHNMTEMQEHFFFRYIYDDGRLDRLPYEWSRHTAYPENDPRSLHVFSASGLTLKGRIPAGGGLRPGGIEAGMLRANVHIRPGMFIETRVKLPHGSGLLPAFWLIAGAESAEHVFTPTPWPPEIDIFEFLEFDPRPVPTVMEGRIQVKDDPASYGWPHDIMSKFVDNKYSSGVDFSKDYHVFALDWITDQPIWLIDGVPIKQTYYKWGNLPAHVLIGNQIGLTMPGVDVSQINASGSDWDFDVKYLRIWQRTS